MPILDHVPAMPRRPRQQGRWWRPLALIGCMVFAASACSITPSLAQRRAESRGASARVVEDWVLLGSQDVDRSRDRERIDLRAARGRVKAVRLIARRNELELKLIRIRYADGRVHEESRSISMNPNDRTKAIDPGSAEKFVDEVDLMIVPNKSARGPDRLSTVEIWGLATSDGATAERPAKSTPATSAPVVAGQADRPAPARPSPPADAQAALPPPASPPVTPTQPLGSAQTSVPASVSAPVAVPATQPPAPQSVPAPASGPPQVPAPAGSVDPGVAGPPGSAPPLPPSRGPHGRSAALQKTPSPPVPTPVSPSRPDDAREGMYLGRRTLQPAGAVERIAIAGEMGRLDKIRLRVLDAGLRITQVKVLYAAGAPEILTYQGDVTSNARTPWLSIPGDRIASEVEITHSRWDAARGAATVELYGTHAEGYLDPGGEGARLVRYNGWVPLGAKTSALRIGFDQLDFEIGPNRGGFRKLRVDAKERAITLREVRIVYASGEDEIVTIDSGRQKIAAGASFGPIDLRGSSRPIRSLILKTRARFLDSEARGRDAAVIEVWAQH